MTIFKILNYQSLHVIIIIINNVTKHDLNIINDEYKDMPAMVVEDLEDGHIADTYRFGNSPFINFMAYFYLMLLTSN